MRSLFDAFFIPIQKSIIVLACGFGLLMVTVVGWFIWEDSRRFENLTSRYLVSLSESKIVLQDTLTLQREINRFINSIDSTNEYVFDIKIYLNKRLVAQKLSTTPPASFPIHKNSTQSIHTLSGELLELQVTYDFTRKVRDFILQLLGAEAIIIFMYLCIRRYVRYRTKQVAGPLNDICHQVTGLSTESSLQGKSISAPQANGIWEIDKLYTTLSDFISTIGDLQTKIVESAKQEERHKLASRVAHDIRSPLTALNVLLSSENHVSPQSRHIVQGVVTRINEIANSLLASQSQTKPFVVLAKELDEIVAEKALSLPSNIHIEMNIGEDVSRIRGKVNSSHFHRVVSNLLNNSVEATKDEGNIYVSLSAENASRARLSIRDEGVGMSPETLSQLGKPGFSTGKKDGNGIGIPYVMETVKAWGGEFSCESQSKKGTTVSITIPLQS